MKFTETEQWQKIKKFIPEKFYFIFMEGYRWIIYLNHKGSNKKCPLCKKSFKKFIGYGDGECPFCASTPRQRIIYLFLTKKTDLFNKKNKLLHFAPEFCFYRIFSKTKKIEYMPVDIIKSPKAKKEIDMTNIKFPDNYFDCLISLHVLEHIDDDLKAMKESLRVLKKNGFAIHLVPIDKKRAKTYEDKNIKTKEQRIEKYGHPDHKRIYGRDIKDRFFKAGFSIKIFSPEVFLNEKEMDYFGIDKEEDIYFLSK